MKGLILNFSYINIKTWTYLGKFLRQGDFKMRVNVQARGATSFDDRLFMYFDRATFTVCFYQVY